MCVVSRYRYICACGSIAEIPTKLCINVNAMPEWKKRGYCNKARFTNIDTKCPQHRIEDEEAEAARNR